MSPSPGDAKTRRKSPGSQTSLRNRNQQRIVDALVHLGPTTQADLARNTGLSTATVSNIVTRMAADALVSVTPTVQGGRRAMSVRLLGGNGSFAAGVGFGRRHLRVVLVTPDYHVAAEESLALPQGYLPKEGLDLAHKTITRLVTNAGLNLSAMLGIGVGMPGAIHEVTRMPVPGTVSVEWEGFDIEDDLLQRFEVPVFADNDANLGAIAELVWGPYGGVSNLIYLKIGTGIGAGLILNGAPFRGVSGISGEVGHIEAVSGGRPCRCGNRGCLEAEASTLAMLDRARPNLLGIESIEMLIEHALAGDVPIGRVVDEAATHVGRILGNLASILGPEVIVIGGPLVGLGDMLLTPVRRSLKRHVLPTVAKAMTVELSTLNDRGEALGAAAMVFRQAAALA